MKNNTKVDIKSQMEFIKITSKNLKIVLFIIGMVSILIGIYFFSHEFSIGIGFIVGGLFIITLIFTMNKTNLKQLKSGIFAGEIYYNFEFNQDGFTVITTRNNEQISHTNLKYSDIIKVIENQHYLFLYIANAQAYLLDRNAMTEGRIEEVIHLLKSLVKDYKLLK